MEPKDNVRTIRKMISKKMLLVEYIFEVQNNYTNNYRLFEIQKQYVNCRLNEIQRNFVRTTFSFEVHIKLVSYSSIETKM